VLWTQTSIRSDFVRAEAGRAKADSKHIPVKESDVAYGDIPLPFGEMHTEDLSKRELIRAAVVAQLAKPQVQPSALWQASRILRYEVLTWIGIVGGAITLFANLQGVVNLAGWAHWITVHCREYSADFWLWAFSSIGIHAPRELAPAATLITFSLSTAIGARRFRVSEPPLQIFMRRYYILFPIAIIVGNTLGWWIAFIAFLLFILSFRIFIRMRYRTKVARAMHLKRMRNTGLEYSELLRSAGRFSPF
jgi:hypothetical protein